jgi:hypothetical protein
MEEKLRGDKKVLQKGPILDFKIHRFGTPNLYRENHRYYRKSKWTSLKETSLVLVNTLLNQLMEKPNSDFDGQQNLTNS